MLLKITKLQRKTQRAQSSGKEYDGLWLEGMKKFDDKPDEKYEKFIYDWKDAEHIETLENIGVGGYALIKMVRNGRFWDIESVEQWRSEVPDSPTEVYDNTHQPPTPETFAGEWVLIPRDDAAGSYVAHLVRITPLPDV